MSQSLITPDTRVFKAKELDFEASSKSPSDRALSAQLVVRLSIVYICRERQVPWMERIYYLIEEGSGQTTELCPQLLVRLVRREIQGNGPGRFEFYVLPDDMLRVVLKASRYGRWYRLRIEALLPLLSPACVLQIDGGQLV